VKASLYTAKVQDVIRRLASATSFKACFAVDADELFSAGECEVGLHMREFDPKKNDNFEAWAYQRAKWAMQSYLRSIDPLSKGARKAGVTTPCAIDDDAIQPNRGELADEVRHLESCLARLPSRTRRMVRSYYIDRKTMRQVGRAEDCSQQNVQMILRAALRKLRLFYRQSPIAAGKLPPLRPVKHAN
jgi:RNA polymerase sigma factor (sigma-70 family)